jgi:hypothetical protein
VHDHNQSLTKGLSLGDSLPVQSQHLCGIMQRSVMLCGAVSPGPREMLQVTLEAEVSISIGTQLLVTCFFSIASSV